MTNKILGFLRSNRRAIGFVSAIMVLVAGEVGLLNTRFSKETRRFGAVVDNAISATLNSSGLDLKSHKILNLTNGSGAQDGAAFGQIPLAATATPAALGTAAVGTGTKWAKEDHVHVMPRLDQVGNPTASVSMNSQLLTSVADPVSAQDAVTLTFLNKLRDPNYTINVGEDWIGCNAASYATNTAIPGPGGFNAVASGTNSTFACNDATVSGNIVGEGLFKPGTTTTGFGGFAHALTTGTFGLNWYIATAPELYHSQRIKIGQLSNGTDTYTLNIGFFDGFTAAPSNFLGFRHVNGQANYQFVETTGGTTNFTINTGVAVDTNYHLFEITKAFATDTVIGKIDGADVTTSGGPVTAHPTAIISDGAYALNSAGTGAGRSFQTDWIRTQVRFSTARN